MAKQVDYHIEKYQFTELKEDPAIARQWADVISRCRDASATSEQRLRMALLGVDYVSSFELPFRLFLIRAPQLIADIRTELKINQKSVLFNGKRFGCVYSLKKNLNVIPDEFNYRLSNRIRRIDPEGAEATPYQQIARETKVPKQRLKLALESGLSVTALDGLFWFGIQRMAADIQRLRKAGMIIATSEINAFDTLTGTLRRVPVYRLSKR